MKKTSIIATVLISAAFLIWFYQQPTADTSSPDGLTEKIENILSPASTDTSDIQATPSVENSSTTALEPVNDTNEIPIATALPTEPTTHINAWQVGTEPLSDKDYYRIADALRNDPDFLAAMMLEFRGETDSRRLKVLAALLSEVEDASITTLAADMAASGNTTSEMAALTLLGKIQHRNPDARQIIMEAISTRTEESVLVAAINAMGIVSKETSLEQKTDVINRVSPLTQHKQAAVRRQSYTILFRWAADVDYLLPQLRTGLQDSDPSVRRITALSFAEFPQPDEATKLELFSMLNNIDETTRNRKAAASALNQLSLAADEKTYIKAIVKKLRGR